MDLLVSAISGVIHLFCIMKFFVIAGHASEAYYWINREIEQEAAAGNLVNKSDYIYVSDVSKLKGYANPHGRFVGSWKNRQDIILIIEQLLIASHNPNPALLKVRDEIWKNASHTQASTAAVNNAAKQLSDAIDAEVMRKIKESSGLNIDVKAYEPSPFAAIMNNTWSDWSQKEVWFDKSKY